jgi:hypothetical protein
MKNLDFDVKCLLCGFELGQIISGKFIRSGDTPRPVARPDGTYRCTRCGGSLYFEPVDSSAAIIRSARLATLVQEEINQAASA